MNTLNTKNDQKMQNIPSTLRARDLRNLKIDKKTKLYDIYIPVTPEDRPLDNRFPIFEKHHFLKVVSRFEVPLRMFCFIVSQKLGV
jgi:hypothetical protein